MGKKPKTKMPRSQRAKQFAPFKALDGLEDALRKAEEEHRRALEQDNVISVKIEGEIGDLYEE